MNPLFFIPDWWLVCLAIILVWNGFHSFIAYRQHSRELKIKELHAHSHTAQAEGVRAGKNLPQIPGTVEAIIGTRHAMGTVSPSNPASSSPAVAAASASAPPAPTSGEPREALPVAHAEELRPIETVRIPQKGGELIIGGYADPRLAGTDAVSFRIAFLRFDGQQEAIGSYTNGESEEEVIRQASNKARKRIEKLLRQSSAAGTNNASIARSFARRS